MSFDAAKFEAFVGSLGLKHFNHKELLTRTNYAKNSPPPAKLWHNIAPTILVLDALREEVGKPIKLISGYRTEAYNDYKNHDGRAPLSQHQAFTAIDFSVSGMKPDDVKALLRKWENDRWFYSPLDFQRTAERLSIGAIPFGESPRKFSLGKLGCWFTFRGYIKAYGVSFTHLDTRGMTATTSGGG